MPISLVEYGFLGGRGEFLKAIFSDVFYGRFYPEMYRASYSKIEVGK